MPAKHADTERIGGPGAAHENRKHPEKSKPRGPHPAERKSSAHSGPSGGGGEPDVHHAHTPPARAAQRGGRSGPAVAARDEDRLIGRGLAQESGHNKHNDSGQDGHGPQNHSPAEEKR